MFDVDADIAVEKESAQREFRWAEEQRLQREAVIAERRAEIIAEEQREKSGLQPAALEIQPDQPEPPAPPADPDAAFRRVRLGIVAVIVLILFWAWIAQRRGVSK